MEDLANKMGRLRALTKCRKVPAAALARIGSALLAGPFYGCDVQPLHQAALRRIRRQAADLRRLGCKAGSPDLLWAVQPRGADPLCGR